jgi:hypothetical protein
MHAPTDSYVQSQNCVAKNNGKVKNKGGGHLGKRCKVLQKLNIPQLVNKFLAFHGRFHKSLAMNIS